jgi:8-oxo-dGTP pyrophosphatase MutT (NUDIX family)
MAETPKIFNIGVKGVITDPVRKQALVLLAQRNDGSKYWDIPGGRIDGIETPEITLIRELKEEIVNFPESAEIGQLLSAYRLSRELEGGLGLMLLFYQVSVELDEIELSSEHTSYRWVALDDLANLDGSEGAQIEQGYLEALRTALTGLVARSI